MINEVRCEPAAAAASDYGTIRTVRLMAVVKRAQNRTANAMHERRFIFFVVNI